MPRSFRSLALILIALAVALGLGWYLAVSPERQTMVGVAAPAAKAKPSRPAALPPTLDARDGLSPDGTTAVPPDRSMNPSQERPDKIIQDFLDERTSTLTTALGLDAAQGQRLRAIYARRLPDREALRRAAAAPDDDESAMEVLLRGADTMRQLRRPGAFADEVGAVLRPDQRAAWSSALEKMTQDDAEIASTRELAAIQSRLSLTEVQKDEIYRVLHALTRAEQTEPGVSLRDPERDQQQIDKRASALSHLFDEAGQATLRRALDSASAERWFLPLEPLDVFGESDASSPR